MLELQGERRGLAGCSGGIAEAAPVVHLQGMVYQNHWGLSSPSADIQEIVVLLGPTINTFQVFRVAGEDSSWSCCVPGF